MGSKSSGLLAAVGAVAGAVVGTLVAPGIGTAAGASISSGAAAGIGAGVGAVAGGAGGYSVGHQQDKALKSAQKAADQQAQQAQNLIKEQENAAAAEKEKANAVRRNAFANKSQTNYSTALGEYSSDVSSNVKKKTLLGG